MGAQASKQATRRLPRQANPETLSNRPAESPSTVRQQQQQQQDPSFEKPLEEGFENEQLLKNLQAIGPVKIDPTTTKMRTSDKMLHIIKERQRIEEDEDLGRVSSMPNRATIDVIFSALERRKHLSPGELEKVLPQLQKEYQIEQSTLKTLFKYYNTMAVMPPVSDEEGARQQGIWVNDKQEWNRALDEAIAKRKALAQQAQKKKASSSTDSTGGKDTKAQEKDPQQKRLEDLFED